MVNLPFKDVDVGGGPIGLSLNFNITGYQKASEEIVARITNMTMWFEQIFIPAFHAIHRQHFLSKGHFGGVGALWAVPYSEDYEKAKAKIRSIEDIGQLFDPIWESLTGITDDSIVIVSPTSITIGTQAVAANGWMYPLTQQTGARTRLGKYNPEPSRPRTDSEQRSVDTKRQQAMDNEKTDIPPRPPIAPTVPQNVLDGMSGSFTAYILWGRMIGIPV